MKLGEALAIRSDLNKRIAQIRARLPQNVQTQKGVSTPEDPNALLQEYSSLCDQMRAMVLAINLTNSANKIESGESITSALARRDYLKDMILGLRVAADSASERNQYYSASEIKVVRKVDVENLRKRIDQFSAQLRQLDVKIQEANWTVDLVE